MFFIPFRGFYTPFICIKLGHNSSQKLYLINLVNFELNAHFNYYKTYLVVL